MQRERKKSLFILKHLSEKPDSFAGIFESFIVATLGKSYKGAAPLVGFVSEEDYQLKLDSRRVRTLLGALKQQGLVATAGQGEGWRLTEKGKRVVTSAKEEASRYVTQVGKEILIVSYDIPERHRKQRGWIRGVLRLLGFEMIHKSLWAGKVILPETFLKEVEERGILSAVHIFAIGKSGTLKKIS